MTPIRRLNVAALAFACAFPIAAFAQSAPAGTPERVRGELASVQGDTLVLRSADGGSETVKMAEGWTVRTTKPGTLASITPGSAIGVVSRGPADHPTAVAIQVFAPGAVPKLGQSPWDMIPESTMTNAMVSGEVTGTGEKALTLKIDDKVIPMTVAPNASIGVAGTGDKAMLKPGAKLVVLSVKGADGSHTGRIAIVGLDGSTPPL